MSERQEKLLARLVEQAERKNAREEHTARAQWEEAQTAAVRRWQEQERQAEETRVYQVGRGNGPLTTRTRQSKKPPEPISLFPGAPASKDVVQPRQTAYNHLVREPRPGTTYLTRGETAWMLNCSLSTVDRLRRADILLPKMRGRFLRSEVEALAEQGVEPDA